MDPNNVKQEAFTIANRLISLDPVDYDSAINQYFDANAVLDHKAIYLSGASRLKKIAYLNSLLCQESQLDQEPVYNDRDDTLRIHFRRVYQTPVIPRIFAFSQYLSAKKITLHYAAVLHLMPDGSGAVENNDGNDGEGNKLYVTRVSDLARYERFPLERLFPFWLIRPIITFLALTVAHVAYFFEHHRNESPVTLILSAVSEIYGALWTFLLAEKSTRQAQAEYWRAEKGAQVDRLLEQARSKASYTLNDIQYRAKKAGIPVEQYKTQLSGIYAHALHLAEGNFSQLEQRAKDAGVPLEEYKKQAGAMYAQAVSVANEGYKELEERAKAMGVPVDEYRKMVEHAIDEVRKRAVKGFEQARENFDDALNDVDQDRQEKPNGKQQQKKKKDHQTSAAKQQKPTNDTPADKDSASDGQHDVPRTPLGGHDPLAPNAPSYAAAAAEEAHNDVPEGARTPLGGHDPLAPDAPSYAAAAAEE